MNEEKDSGGPAFPVPAIHDIAREQINSAAAYTGESGMTLRDYFAAKAMTAMVYADTDCGRYREPPVLDRCAALSYAMADAMLAARGKP